MRIILTRKAKRSIFRRGIDPTREKRLMQMTRFVVIIESESRNPSTAYDRYLCQSNFMWSLRVCAAKSVLVLGLLKLALVHVESIAYCCTYFRLNDHGVVGTQTVPSSTGITSIGKLQTIPKSVKWDHRFLSSVMRPCSSKSKIYAMQFESGVSGASR